MNLIATDIQWETDGVTINLPNEVIIPNSIIPDDVDINEYIHGETIEIEDYLSDTYGFLVCGFIIEKAE